MQLISLFEVRPTRNAFYYSTVSSVNVCGILLLFRITPAWHGFDQCCSSSVTLGIHSIMTSYNRPRDGYQVPSAEHLGDTQFVTAEVAKRCWVSPFTHSTSSYWGAIAGSPLPGPLQGCPGGLLCSWHEPSRVGHRFVSGGSRKESSLSNFSMQALKIARHTSSAGRTCFSFVICDLGKKGRVCRSCLTKGLIRLPYGGQTSSHRH